MDGLRSAVRRRLPLAVICTLAVLYGILAVVYLKPFENDSTPVDVRSGSWSRDGTVYTNPWARLSFTLPDGFTVKPIPDVSNKDSEMYKQFMVIFANTGISTEVASKSACFGAVVSRADAQFSLYFRDLSALNAVLRTPYTAYTYAEILGNRRYIQEVDIGGGAWYMTTFVYEDYVYQLIFVREVRDSVFAVITLDAGSEVDFDSPIVQEILSNLKVTS